MCVCGVCRLKRNDCGCPDTHLLWCLTYKAAWHLTRWYLSMDPEVRETISLQTIWLNGTPLPRKLRYPQSPSVELSHRGPSGHAVVCFTGSGLHSFRFTLHSGTVTLKHRNSWRCIRHVMIYDAGLRTPSKCSLTLLKGSWTAFVFIFLFYFVLFSEIHL